MQPPAGAAKDLRSVHGQPSGQGKSSFSFPLKNTFSFNENVTASSAQIVARKEQLAQAKKDLKEVKKEAKKNDSDAKLQA